MDGIHTGRRDWERVGMRKGSESECIGGLGRWMDKRQGTDSGDDKMHVYCYEEEEHIEQALIRDT